MIRVTWAGAAAIIGGSIGILAGALLLGVAHLLYELSHYIDHRRRKR